MRLRSVLPLGAAGAVGLLLAGCGAASTAGEPSDAGAAQVLASFYPLQYVAEQVGGDLVEVSSLTPPGAEPHDVELSPRQVRAVDETDLVLYLSGFQSAVDEAIEARDPALVLDAADLTDLVEEHEDEHEGEGEAHAAEDDAVDHDHAGVDPHFWLDPQLLAALAQPVAEALTEVDPDHAAEFADGAARLGAELAELDDAYATGLAACERRVLVTSHRAFGYLTRAYDLEQVGISGLDPEAEPSPARLREIGDVVRAEGVTTVFTETLVSPRAAQTLADDLSVTTAVLDPVESLTEPASDYRTVMEQNLTALRSGLGCA